MKSKFINTFVSIGFTYLCLALSGEIQVARAQNNAMPSSGTCALLVTMPVPYLSTSALGETGYNLIGVLSFTSASTGIFNGSVVNPTFSTNSSPYISPKSTIYLRNFTVNVNTLDATNGFVGGYKLMFSGTINNTNSAAFEFIGVPTNNGKTILLQASSEGSPNKSGFGPGSGVCQS
jgi:hypothetical protein